MISRKDKKIRLIYFGLLFIAVAIYLTYRLLRNEALNRNSKVVNAFVSEVNFGGSKASNIVIKYSFFYNGKTYRGGIDCGLSYSIRDSILNKNFPVLFDSTNPSNNVLLVDKNDWEKLNLPFPDSLKWLNQFYR